MANSLVWSGSSILKKKKKGTVVWYIDESAKASFPAVTTS